MSLCWRCGSSVVGPAFRVAPSRLDALHEEATPRDLWKRDFETVAIPSYPAIHVGAGAMVILYGPPGSGKSTMATRALLGVKGVYISAEEGISGALAARVKRVGLRGDDVLFLSRVSVDGVLDAMAARRPDFLVIDSISSTSFLPGEIRRILNTAPIKAALCVQQVTKDGSARGSLEYIHEADIVIRVENFKWAIEKSRYQSPVNGAVWEERDDAK